MWREELPSTEPSALMSSTQGAGAPMDCAAAAGSENTRAAKRIIGCGGFVGGVCCNWCLRSGMRMVSTRGRRRVLVAFVPSQTTYSHSEY